MNRANIIYNKYIGRIAVLFCFVVSCVLLVGCNDAEENSIKEDPYAGGREPLKIKLLDETPDPESAGPGERVIFQASGLAQYCHPDGTYDFRFYISDEECIIEEATDSTVTVVIPENLSSGSTYLRSKDDQIFYGPYFKVAGSVTIDDGFEYYKEGPLGGIIYGCLPWCKNSVSTSEFYLYGDFRKDKNTQYYGGLAMINNETGLIKYGTSGKFSTKSGINLLKSEYVDGAYYASQAYVAGLEYWKQDKSTPQILIYGNFSDYDDVGSNYRGFDFKNICLFQNDFSVAKVSKEFWDIRNKKHTISVPKFVGGTVEKIVRAFSTSDGKIIAVGNVNLHAMTDYENTTCDIDGKYLATTVVYTEVASILRMDAEGKLDTSYRRLPGDVTKPLPGVTGTINDACMLKDESVVMVGNMTGFENKNISNIVKLKADGTIDDEFMLNIGAGADGEIVGITNSCFNDETGTPIERIVIVGSFNNFNGKECVGLVVLSPDGTFDSDFELKEMKGGRPNFAKFVDLNANGNKPMPHLVISGTFNRYAGITRRGFLILDTKGDAIQRFNVPGEFYGQIKDAQYSLTSDNTNGLLLTGSIDRFDGNSLNNIVMLKVELDNINN